MITNERSKEWKAGYTAGYKLGRLEILEDFYDSLNRLYNYWHVLTEGVSSFHRPKSWFVSFLKTDKKSTTEIFSIKDRISTYYDLNDFIFKKFKEIKVLLTKEGNILGDS